MATRGTADTLLLQLAKQDLQVILIALIGILI